MCKNLQQGSLEPATLGSQRDSYTTKPRRLSHFHLLEVELYSKTPIAYAPIYWIPRFTRPQFDPPKQELYEFMCNSMQVPRFTRSYSIPPRGPVNQGFTASINFNVPRTLATNLMRK